MVCERQAKLQFFKLDSLSHVFSIFICLFEGTAQAVFFTAKFLYNIVCLMSHIMAEL